MKQERLGFLGLGSMGFAMCCGLHKAGYRMILPGWRRESMQRHGFSSIAPDGPAKAAQFDKMVAEGAVSAPDQVSLIAQSDVILLSLPTSAQVESVVLGEDGILAHAAPGSVVIDLTSGDAAVSRRLAAQLEARGVDFLDSPVSGGTHKAVSQQLTMMAGGRDDVFARCKPILETIGDPANVFHLGPVGAGDTVKCVNNFLSATAITALTEAVSVAAASGVDPQKLIDVVNVSGGRSNASMFIYPNIVFRGEAFHMLVDLWRKDVALFQQAAKEQNIPAFIAATVYQMWSRLSADGNGQRDAMCLIREYERWCGRPIVGLAADAQPNN